MVLAVWETPEASTTHPPDNIWVGIGLVVPLPDVVIGHETEHRGIGMLKGGFNNLIKKQFSRLGH